MERGMQRRVASVERQLGQSDLSRLSDAELATAINDVHQRQMAGYAAALDRFSTAEQADQAEVALRRIVARGEAAARLIAGRMAPRAANREDQA